MAANKNQQATQTSQASQAAATAEQKLAEYQQMAQEYGEQANEMIRENPMASVLIGFGVGMGVGLLISSLISGPSPSHRRGYNMQMAEDLGRQMLDGIKEYIPDIVARRFS
jgi:uncharacterized protein YacL